MWGPTIMRRCFITAIVLTMTAVAAPYGAEAADLPIKAPARPEMAPYNWTGFYFGASVGGRWSQTEWTTTGGIGFPPVPPFAGAPTSPASFDSVTARGGVHLGYNWQLAPRWLTGVEADAGWGDSKKTIAGIPGTVCTPACVPFAQFDSSSVRETWDASLRARLGYLLTPTLLVFATGGVAWQHFDINASCVGGSGPSAWCIAVRSETVSWTKPGWTFGGGIETAISDAWRARAEYRYADFGNVSHQFFAASIFDQVPMAESMKTHTVTIGLTYAFGAPAAKHR